MDVDGSYGDFLIDDMYFWRAAMKPKDVELLPEQHMNGKEIARMSDWLQSSMNAYSCIAKFICKRGNPRFSTNVSML